MNVIVQRFLKKLQNLFLNKNFIDFVIRITLIIILISTALFIFQKLTAKNEKHIEKKINMSSFNDGSSGTMALKEFLESYNYQTKRLAIPFVDIKTSSVPTKKTLNAFKKESDDFGTPGVILCIEPQMPFDDKKAEITEKLAEAGHVIMIFSGNEYKIGSLISKPASDNKKDNSSDSVLSAFFAKNDLYKECSDDVTRLTYDQFGIKNKISTLSLTNKKRLKKWDKGWSVALRDKQGPIMIQKKIGKGKMLVCSESSFLSNYQIRKNDNGPFAFRLISFFAENKPVIYFDEYSHGFMQKLTLWYFLAKKEYLRIIVQTLIFFLFLFFAFSVKFGQYKEKIKPEEKKIYYYSEGIAGLLAKRKFSSKIFDLMVSNFKKMKNLMPNKTTKEKALKINDFTKKHKNKSVSDVTKLFEIMKKE